jgi:hypothetical protein
MGRCEPRIETHRVPELDDCLAVFAGVEVRFTTTKVFEFPPIGIRRTACQSDCQEGHKKRSM